MGHVTLILSVLAINNKILKYFVWSTVQLQVSYLSFAYANTLSNKFVRLIITQIYHYTPIKHNVRLEPHGYPQYPHFYFLLKKKLWLWRKKLYQYFAPLFIYMYLIEMPQKYLLRLQSAHSLFSQNSSTLKNYQTNAENQYLKTSTSSIKWILFKRDL